MKQRANAQPRPPDGLRGRDLRGGKIAIGQIGTGKFMKNARAAARIAPGRRKAGRSKTCASVSPSPSATRSRAEDRGEAGRVAISASGRSKSKSLSFTAQDPFCKGKSRYCETCGGGRRKMSRNMPGVKTESGFTATCGVATGPRRVKLKPISPSPLRAMSRPTAFST